MAKGTFPKQVQLGPKAVGWIEAEIDAWIAARIAARDLKKAEASDRQDIDNAAHCRSAR